MRVIPQEEGRRVPVKMWTDGVPVEEGAVEQLKRVAELPFIFKHVVAMPDVHVGVGCCVGAVVATEGAVVPSLTGVDIGCGMAALQTSLRRSDLPEDLRPIRKSIETAVPHGRTDEGGRNDRGAWGTVPNAVGEIWQTYLAEAYSAICKERPRLSHRRPVAQLGTLGTGNHFIEVSLDEKGSVWIVLHSGSRGPGNRIGTEFIALAKKEAEERKIELSDRNLAYLPEASPLFSEYLKAVTWAQSYAFHNRIIMAENIVAALRESGLAFDVEAPAAYPPDPQSSLSYVHCHHNYIAWENHFGRSVIVTRKGAVRARTGEMGIIPGSMGARTYIVRGKGSEESFTSCSHGAGRAMSRTQAKKQYTVTDHEKATEGVECRKDEEVIDETPMAYKSIEAVMAAQSDLVETVHVLKQIVCVKG